jgi:hypothetical protein
MKYAGNKGCAPDNYFVPIPDSASEVSDQPPEILFFRAVIKGEDREIGGDEEDDEEDF